MDKIKAKIAEVARQSGSFMSKYEQIRVILADLSEPERVKYLATFADNLLAQAMDSGDVHSLIDEIKKEKDRAAVGLTEEEKENLKIKATIYAALNRES